MARFADLALGILKGPRTKVPDSVMKSIGGMEYVPQVYCYEDKVVAIKIVNWPGAFMIALSDDFPTKYLHKTVLKHYQSKRKGPAIYQSTYYDYVIEEINENINKFEVFSHLRRLSES